MATVRRKFLEKVGGNFKKEIKNDLPTDKSREIVIGIHKITANYPQCDG